MEARRLPNELLLRLLDIARNLAQNHELDGLLQDILQHSLELIPGSDFSCLFLYRPEDNLLIPVCGVGFDMDFLKDVHIKPGESMTGRAFNAKRALLFATAGDVQEALATLSPKNDALLKSAVKRPTNPLRSSVCAPLILGDQVVGVLVVDNYDTDRDFTAEDLQIASILANHAAVAVKNAEDYLRAESLGRQLQETITIQRRLMLGLLDETDSLSALSRRLSDIIQGPVRVIGSNGLEFTAIGKRQNSPESLFPIIAGGEQLGLLAVARQDLEGIRRIAVDQALPLYAIELLKMRTLLRQRLQVQADFLTTVLHGNIEAIVQEARLYQLGDEQPWQFIVIGSDSSFQPTIPRLAELVDRIGEIGGLIRIFGEMREALVCLIHPTPAINSWPRILAREGQPGVIIVEGRPHHRLDLLPSALANVLAVWTCWKTGLLEETPGPNSVIVADNYPEAELFASINARAREWFVQQVLGPLLNEPTLLDTLRAWVVANRSFAEAAKKLFTHSNTVRYRIEKIQELLQLNFRNDTDWLRVRIAVLLANWPKGHS